MTHRSARTRPRATRPPATPGNRCRTCLHVTLPAFGRINLGPPDQLAYLAGIAALTALEIIEWPVAVMIAADHLLAEQRRSNALHAFVSKPDPSP